jgi:hypothetical protein
LLGYKRDNSGKITDCTIMKVDIPEPTDTEKLRNDGASLPLWFRRYVRAAYGVEMLKKIDKAGHLHDALMDRHPERLFYNRLLFYTQLYILGVSVSLIRQISVGLCVYDACPSWLKRMLKKTT